MANCVADQKGPYPELVGQLLILLEAVRRWCILVVITASHKQNFISRLHKPAKQNGAWISLRSINFKHCRLHWSTANRGAAAGTLG